MNKYLTFHFLISLVYICSFAIYFGKSIEIVLIHFAILLAVNTLIFYLHCIYKNKYAEVAVFKYIMALVFSIYWLVISGVCLMNWISNSHWGNSVLASFYLDIFEHVDSINRLKNYPGSLIYFLITVVVVVTYWGAVKFVQLKALSSKNKKLMFLAGIFFMLSVSYLTLMNQSRHLPGVWGGEPIMTSFSMVNQRYNSSRSMRQRLADEVAREELLAKLPHVVAKKKDIIFIIADALRADHLPVYGYERETAPNISELALQNNFQKVDNFTSTCSESGCGIMAALASREFSDIGFGLYDVSDALKDVGYKKYFILSSNHAINSLNDLYGTNHDMYVDGSSYWPKLSMYDDNSILLNMDKIPTKTESPAFFYFHFVSTHEIGNIEPENEVFTPYRTELSSHASFKSTELPEKIKEELVNGYDNGVFQFDRYLKKLLKKLQAKGYLENSIIIITSDHGEGLGERGNYYHTYNLYQEDIMVPLIFIDTLNECNLADSRYGTLIDIAPTIFDCLNLPKVSTWQGNSLLQKSVFPRYSFHQTFRDRTEYALIKYDGDHIYKLIASEYRGKLSNFRLFNLDLDPKEEKNLIDSVDESLFNEMKSMIINKR